MKFAHMGDCHLGAWSEPELRALNLESFQYALNKCIKEKVEFIIISGDLFDSAYPSIEVLKDVFQAFRKVKEAGIPVFLIAGSHDYSVSGKTFLEVLAKAGFCINVEKYIEKDGRIILEPTIYKNAAIYGYPGKKSGLEVEEINRMKIQDSPGMFKILVLHTAIRDAVKNLPIDAVSEKNLPNVDYLALSHLHINYNKENRAYSGPIFPNNMSELEELGAGSFCIYENGSVRRELIKIKEVMTLDIEIKSALNAKDEIISLLDDKNLSNKIVILKMHGIIETGKINDIDFAAIDSFAMNKGAFCFLRSTTKLFMHESEMKIDMLSADALENQIISGFEEKNQNKFNVFIPELFKALQAEKQEDERSMIFEERLLSEVKKVLDI